MPSIVSTVVTRLETDLENLKLAAPSAFHQITTFETSPTDARNLPHLASLAPKAAVEATAFDEPSAGYVSPDSGDGFVDDPERLERPAG
jgi:hypothetical protein